MRIPLVCWVSAVAVAAIAGCAPTTERISRGMPGETKEARIAGKDLATMCSALEGDSRQANLSARQALARFASSMFSDGALRETRFQGTDGLTYHVQVATNPADWPASLLSRLQKIQPPRDKRPTPLRWDGLGLPMLGINEPDREREPFAPRQGYRLPVTVTVGMHRQGDVVNTSIRLVNPYKTTSIRMGGKEQKVAGDLEAANAATFRTRNLLLTGLRWLVAVNQFDYPTRLIFAQPHDPQRIPVVLVHGLLSTPTMWGAVIRELEADPVIRRNFEFWAFFYPTGQPVPLSAWELRDQLQAAGNRYSFPKGIVLVGHSMGGILSRAQVSSSGGSQVFNEVFDDDAPRVAKRLPEAPLLRNTLFFEANPDVNRAVFICTPHQGSALAMSGPVGLFTSLIRLPDELAPTFSILSDATTSVRFRRLPTSICGLSPRSAFLQALNRRPIEVPHHTILGDRGRGDSPNSSDGVVTYESAHLPTAESEAIIPAGHGAFQHPLAIAEIRRILVEDLQSSRHER